MLKLLKAYKKIILIALLPYLAVLFVLIYPTSYSVTAPGGLTPVDDFIAIDGIELQDNFYTIHVLSYYPITLFQSWILKNDERMDVDPITPLERDTSAYENYLKGQLSKHVSLNNSIISAYELASEVRDDVYVNYTFDGLYVYTRPSRLSELKIGDHVVKINGTSFEGLTPQAFADLIDMNQFELTVRREVSGVDIEVDINYVKQEEDVNFSFYIKYNIIDSFPSFDLPGLNQIVGGPSGGLLQTLTLYASLVNINIGDDKIAGTGTISVTGNVGRIGGITQKIYTAIDQNVDIFFIPISHVSEIENIDFDFILVPVSNLREAVKWLYEYYDGSIL
ncbi:MAG: S16 family serine protease [Acholeplasmataceae bacterium]|jgi:PDZ domain-containing protein|nr:S16 family serine protease [Acholeplasmataceae bacterium]